MKKIIIYTAAALLVAGLSGCQDWFDVNTSPNSPTTAQMTEALMLPALQYDMLNNHVNSTNAWQLSHHLTKSGEFSGNYTFLNGQVMPQDLDSWWSTYYSINYNLKFVNDMAVENEDLAYQGITEVLQVINYQRVVDIWGNVPYTEAVDPENYTQPKYDKAEDIYSALITKIDDAITKLQATVGNYNTSELKSVDIICHGDLEQWVRLAYSVKLRILMRVSAVASQVPGLNLNQELTDLVGKTIAISENMRVYADPRRELGDDADGNAYYSNHGLENEYYVGIPYGQANPAGEEYTCTTGTGLLAGSSDKNNGRVRSSTFIAGSEVGFLLAEAALKGYIPGGETQAKQYYEEAVTSAFKRHEAAMQDPTENFTNYVGDPMVGMKDPITGSAEDAARTYLDQNDPFCNWDLMDGTEAKFEAICTQRWLAFVGYNPLETWFEHRRTDYPRLTSSAQSPVTKNYCRLPYPQTERNLNASNVMAEPETDIFESVLFWDVINPTVEQQMLYQ